MTENFKGPGQGELRRQWYGDGGVGRGVDPEAARDIGYRPPGEPAASVDEPGVKEGTSIDVNTAAAGRRVVDRDSTEALKRRPRANEVRLSEVKRLRHSIWPDEHPDPDKVDSGTSI